LINQNSIASFDLSFNRIGIQGALAFTRLLNLKSTLIELNLRKNEIQKYYGEIEKDEIELLITAYEKNTNLTSLDLSWNVMSEQMKNRYELVCKEKNQNFNNQMIVNFELKEYKQGSYSSDRIRETEKGRFYFNFNINCYCDGDSDK